LFGVNHLKTSCFERGDETLPVQVSLSAGVAMLDLPPLAIWMPDNIPEVRIETFGNRAVDGDQCLWAERICQPDEIGRAGMS
jgi:hypothetical protein